MESLAKQPLQILHVDDSEDHCVIMRSMLVKTGLPHQLIQCTSKQEVLEFIAKKQHLAIVLLDYHLGDSTSEDMLDWFEGIPVVVVTVHEDDNLDSHLMKQGAADFLSKSEMSPRLLKRIIRHALDRQCILNQFIEESWHDSLTGLYNRRFAMRELSRLTSMAKRYGNTFCVCVIDVDGLKPVNDQHGHLAGDAAIKFIASALNCILREGDISARIGGDEFLAIFPNTSCASAKKSLQRLLDHLHAQPLIFEDQTLALSVSCGLVDSKGELPDSLFARADAELYRAKTAGKGSIATG